MGEAPEPLTCTLRLLFAGLPKEDIVLALNEALGDNAFIVTQAVQELNYIYSCFWLSTDEFTDRIESGCVDGEEKFIGTRADLEKAVYDAYATTPDGIYETMGFHMDEYIEVWRQQGLVVPVTSEGNDNA